MRSKVTMSDAVGSKCAVSRIHSPTYTAWELYASMIILVAVQIRLCFKPVSVKSLTLELSRQTETVGTAESLSYTSDNHVFPISHILTMAFICHSYRRMYCCRANSTTDMTQD